VRKTSDERLIRLLDQQDLAQQGAERWLAKLLFAAGKLGKIRRQLRDVRRRIVAREAELRSDAARRANATRRANSGVTDDGRNYPDAEIHIGPVEEEPGDVE
jgi:hypothetical protein